MGRSEAGGVFVHSTVAMCEKVDIDRGSFLRIPKVRGRRPEELLVGSIKRVGIPVTTVRTTGCSKSVAIRIVAFLNTQTRTQVLAIRAFTSAKKAWRKATISNDGSRTASRRRTIERIKAAAEERNVGVLQAYDCQSLQITAEMLGLVLKLEMERGPPAGESCEASAT